MRKFEIVGPWAFENKCLLYGDFQGQGANTLKIIAKTPKNNQDPEKTPKNSYFRKLSEGGKHPVCLQWTLHLLSKQILLFCKVAKLFFPCWEIE